MNRQTGGFRTQGILRQQATTDKPLVTVVTVVLNGAEHLAQTIQSVIRQDYDALEYIVIDGGSADGSLDIIKQYEQAIDYWCSEPDHGIADAMNRGVRQATGDYVLFIHADDYLFTTRVLSEAMQQIGEESIALFRVAYGSRLKPLQPRGFGAWMNVKTGVLHQGAVCRTSVFDAIGGFDTDFKIVMDYDFFLRAYRNGLSTRRYAQILSVMRDTGISSQTDWPSLSKRFGEERRVHEKNACSFWIKALYQVYWPMYWYYRKWGYSYGAQ